MALFENFPYTNFHDLNLDWILQTLRDQQTQIDDFVSTSTIKYADPMQWDITQQYGKNTIVVGPDGTAYISIKEVPNGAELTNKDYWLPIFDYDNIIDKLREQIAHNNLTHETFDVDLTADSLFFYNGDLYRTTKDVGAGDKIVAGKNCIKCTVEDAINFYPVYTEDSENLLFKGSLNG